MTEYTPEDFANARFADHARGGTAASTGDPMDTHPWALGNETYLSHADMAVRGWRPVVEVEDPEAIVALIGRQATRIRELERTMAALNTLTAPDTLDTLREAWENAEQSEDCQVGDTLIDKISDADEYVVWAAGWGVELERARILKRAPQPEPWQALADVLGDVLIGTPEDIARALYGKGVRVTGGDDDE